MNGLKRKIGAGRDWIGYTVWNCINCCIFGLSRCRIGVGMRTRGRVRVRNRGSISIGESTVINSSIMANPLGGNVCTILVALAGSEIRIGNHVGLSNCVIFARRHISIGDHVMLGAGVKIYDSDFHPVDFQDRMDHKPPKCEPVIIEDGAFIGAHSIILKGVTIGRRSVVGAGSVVTKNIPKNQIWAGNPARFIRQLDEEVENT